MSQMVQADVTGSSPAEATPKPLDPYLEGIGAGTIGAAIIAIWFLIIDSIRGRPFYTPSVLGMVLFKPGGQFVLPENVPISFEFVMVYTWVHWMVFCVIGGAASLFIRAAERRPNLGFGIVLVFAVFEFGFLVGAMLFAEVILRALAWPEILLGNLLAAVGMAAYFWRHHRRLVILP